MHFGRCGDRQCNGIPLHCVRDVSPLRSPEASIKRFYFDTVTHDPAVLRELAEFAGADHIVLGTDHPFELRDPDPVGTVRAAGLDVAATRAISCSVSDGSAGPSSSDSK